MAFIHVCLALALVFGVQNAVCARILNSSVVQHRPSARPAAPAAPVINRSQSSFVGDIFQPSTSLVELPVVRTPEENARVPGLLDVIFVRHSRPPDDSHPPRYPDGATATTPLNVVFFLCDITLGVALAMVLVLYKLVGAGVTYVYDHSGDGPLVSSQLPAQPRRAGAAPKPCSRVHAAGIQGATVPLALATFLRLVAMLLQSSTVGPYSSMDAALYGICMLSYCACSLLALVTATRPVMTALQLRASQKHFEETLVMKSAAAKTLDSPECTVSKAVQASDGTAKNDVAVQTLLLPQRADLTMTKAWSVPTRRRHLRYTASPSPSSTPAEKCPLCAPLESADQKALPCDLCAELIQNGDAVACSVPMAWVAA